MTTGSIAKRYARAIVELADEKKLLDKVGLELVSVAELLEQNEELAQLLQNPSVSTADKRKVLMAILAQLELTTVSRNALQLLLDNDRIDHLSAISQQYTERVDEKKGVLRVKVVSATILNQTHLMKIRYVLQNITNMTIEVEAETDASLLGGLRIHVGSLVLDGTLRSQLRNIEQELLTAI